MAQSKVLREELREEVRDEQAEALRRAARYILLGSPEKLLDRVEEHMEVFFADKSRGEAYRKWFRKDFHDPGLKVQDLDQSIDEKFVLSLLKLYLEAFDTMFFSSCLIHNASLTIVPFDTDVDGRRGCLGNTRTRLDFKDQKFSIEIKIALPAKQSASRTRKELDVIDLVATLLHEMIHAYFGISEIWNAEDRGERKRISDIRVLGPGGHGAYFQRIADVLERFVQNDLELLIEMNRSYDFGSELASCSDNLQYRSYYRPLIRELGLCRKEVENFKQRAIQRRLSTSF
jgi:hypothetical protein